TAAQERGGSNVPLAELYDPAEPAIERAGGRVLLSTSVQSIEFDGERVKFVRTPDGQEIFADAFISALPHDRLARLATPEMVEADDRLQPLDQFTTNPILGIHMKFRAPHGGPVMQLPHVVLTDSPLQWIFNKGFDISEANFGAHHLHGVISAASDWVDKPAEEILAMAEAEARKHLTPDIDGAALEWGKVIKEKKATFVPRPGIDAIRPGPVGDIPNLFLAGDWTQTRWPATMEGAVRSGYQAAHAAISYIGGDDRPMLVGDIAPGPLYQVLSG
ncbi:MAG: hydroxysqualene dehydroxylase, partial [Phycisphaeraceae bacterium]